ncbi:MAG: site-specific DNA-methyltransferase [Rubrivivax sp.]
MTVRLIHGDCREVLQSLPAGSVHCCVTSPPYWALRSYLPPGHPNKAREIGAESSPMAYVSILVDVFREVRRVLRRDGTLWLNLGDSYAGSRRGGDSGTGTMHSRQPSHSLIHSRGRDMHPMPRCDERMSGFKPKDLMGLPWRVAFALQDDGWYLRQEIIWAKKSPMPESVSDRFTNAHEHVFLLSKSRRYYFDLAAVREEASEGSHARFAANGSWWPAGSGWGRGDQPRDAAGLSAHKQARGYRNGDGVGRRHGPPGNPAEHQRHSTTIPPPPPERGHTHEVPLREVVQPPAARNPRSVRWLASEPFTGAHFATYPPALIAPFILAGCPVGGTVLDPFGGSGTTGLVADRLQREAILIDLDERNAPMARKRILDDAPLLASVDVIHST